MSLTQEEIRKLAIEHKLIDGYDGDGLVAIDNRLIAYTAAVEAKKRERVLDALKYHNADTYSELIWKINEMIESRK